MKYFDNNLKIYLHSTTEFNKNGLLAKDFFSPDNIEAIEPNPAEESENKEIMNEICDALKSLLFNINNNSDDDAANPQDEIRSILNRKTSNISVDLRRSGSSSRQVSMIGKVLQSERNIITRIMCPAKENKNIIHPGKDYRSIPIRVSNPVYKNIDRDN